MVSRKIICIQCPLGCEMAVVQDGEQVAVEGNKCGRGQWYAREELLAPKRVVTAVVRTSSGQLPRIPVKTDGAVMRDAIPAVLRRIYSLYIDSPLPMGSVLDDDIDGTGVSLVTTRWFGGNV